MAREHRRAKTGRELQRRAAFRRESDRVLIVTEGSKTEPSYFKLLINELGLTTATVTIVGDGGSAPISVVKEAEKQLSKDIDFDQIYCVFDRDRHSTYDAALDAVKRLSERRDMKGKTLYAITSIPCFEIWYLLHISDSRKPYEASVTGGSPAQAVLSDLTRDAKFSGYKKNECASFFSIIKPQRQVAIERAQKFLRFSENEGAVQYHENPSTRVHILVLNLERIANERIV